MPSRSKELEEGIEAFEKEDYSRAFLLLMPLAQAGYAQAQCYVASMYQCGSGVPVDGALAVEWYYKAARQAETEQNISAIAYNNLGTIYNNGMPGVSANHSLARECWRKAVELGFEMMLENGSDTTEE